MILISGMVTDVERRAGKEELIENVYVAGGRETVQVWGPVIADHQPKVGDQVAYEVSHSNANGRCSWRRLRPVSLKGLGG